MGDPCSLLLVFMRFLLYLQACFSKDGRCRVLTVIFSNGSSLSSESIKMVKVFKDGFCNLPMLFLLTTKFLLGRFPSAFTDDSLAKLLSKILYSG